MPLAPGFHRYYGLGLYNSPLGLLIVEGGLWVIGIILYLRATHTRRFAGHLVLWIFIVVFTALWLLSFNGAPPPSVHFLVTVDLILFPIVLRWAYWIRGLCGTESSPQAVRHDVALDQDGRRLEDDH